MMVVYCPELKKCDGFFGGTRRSEGECIFQYNSRFAGKVVEVYLSVTSSNQKKISNSLYVGRITPQL